ncbi:class I SAM-dependent DNA methyltransferase [Roseomonas sp. NAR14]|uniref:site-specific DNA-methyltransferase (adenine-specific) n=1 Tax=Roseomonas acroporae TaxID=2937791 RepID=A0A9X2BY68_9PROT|nr:DNA methyltransferase [Roseomonas acroporae]MCK8788066.1 class I SAM-dependent DNA methyltransferase [Roseomonas acroporae]
MTPDAFVEKWNRNTRPEAAAAKEHFLDLCALLNTPRPNDDPNGSTYAFEKGVTKAGGGKGWADVWKRECFGWEYKSRGHDLDEAHLQLLRYAGALENPPLLVVSDMERIIVRTAWTNAKTERHDFGLRELRDPGVTARLATMWTRPDTWRPAETRQAITEQAAADFVALAQRLRTRGHNAGTVARFVNRLVFCLFAEDVGLLSRDILTDLLALGRAEPGQFQNLVSTLFNQLAERDGRIGFKPVPWFNGGLFANAEALPVDAGDIRLLEQAVARDWSEIDPAIMGTLFERGLDPDKRGQLGAHYTDRATIERIIDPVVRDPLLAEWATARERIAHAMDEREALRSTVGGNEALDALAGEVVTGEAVKARKALAREGERRRRRMADLLARAKETLEAFRARLRDFRVLDPACGSGNFLYVALLALKDLEARVLAEAAALGLATGFPEVGPEAVLGIELNPFAAELARVSVWIGHIQWARRNGYPMPHNPVLRALSTIECRDAILTTDSTPAAWPKAEAIVGNPPFLGGKRLRAMLGDEYAERLFVAHRGAVPAEADLVCYWVARAQAAVVAGRTERAGLVTTNSIRGGANRRVLEPMAAGGTLTEAWSDEPWVLDGAAVRVSLVCWGRERAAGAMLDGLAVPAIHADLTAGSANLTAARRLPENAGVAFMGDTKGGAFDVPGDVARAWLRLPSNANGRTNADVLRPWANGMAVTRRPSDTWIVDFGWTMTDAEAAYYSAPYAHLVEHVRPVRATNKRETYAREWWRHVEPRPGMHRALAGLLRFIVTPTVAKHRLFAWMTLPALADHQLIAIARDDNTTFGILHSRFHEIWALRLGTWLGVGNDPRYTPSTTLETFPFPEGLTPHLPASTYADDSRAQAIAAAARALVEARDRWLNPPELVERVPEVVAGFPDRLLPRSAEAAAMLKRRTLTALYNTRGTPEGAWLDRLHLALDAAVAAAYGWPADISESDVLARLLALNQRRAAD